MICRALAALALGGMLAIFLPIQQTFADATPQAASRARLIEHYRLAVDSDPGNLTFHYLLGVALLQDNQNQQALTELTTAYPAYQESVEAHYNLAIASLRVDDLPSTEIYLEQAIALGADTMLEVYPLASLFFNMAVKSQERGDPIEAIRYFQRTLELNPEIYEVYRQLGDIYAQQGVYPQAINSFTTYLERYPDDPVSRDYLFALEFNRAQDFLAAEKFTEAEQGFNAALALQPDSPTALYYLGYLAYLENRPEVAAAHLGSAYNNADPELQQTIRPLLYNTVLSLREAGQSGLAMQSIAILASDKQPKANELYLAGTLALEANQYRAAQEYLQRASKLDPENESIRKNLFAAEKGAMDEWISQTSTSLDQGELNRADLMLGTVLKMQSGNTKVAALQSRLEQARLHKATALFFNAQRSLDSGDLASALQQVNEGLELRPLDTDGLALREEISKAMSVDLDKLLDEGATELAAGNLGSAELLFNKILAISPQHEQAIEGKERIVTIRKTQSANLLKNGWQAIDSGQADNAIRIFNQLLALDADNEQARQGLLSAEQMQANRIDEMIRKGRQAADREQYSEAKQWLDKARELDHTERAANELKILVEKITQKANHLAGQALEATEKNNFKLAKKLFAKALTISPGHPASEAGLATLQEKVAAAVTSRLNLAEAAYQNKNYQAAMQGFRSVLDIDPQHDDAIEGIQNCRQAQADVLSRLIRQSEEALEKGDYVKASQALNLALETDAFHKKAQQLKQRLELMQQAGAKPGDEYKLYLQGVSFYTQGKYADAIKSWETVLLLDPEHEKSLQNISKTRLKLQQIKEYSGG